MPIDLVKVSSLFYFSLLPNEFCEFNGMDFVRIYGFVIASLVQSQSPPKPVSIIERSIVLNAATKTSSTTRFVSHDYKHTSAFSLDLCCF